MPGGRGGEHPAHPSISSPWGPPGEPGRDLRPSPIRWGPSSPGTGRAATTAGPSLSGDRAARRVLWPRAAAATGVDLAAQAPPATATRVSTPRPHLPFRERAPCRALRPAGRREREPPRREPASRSALAGSSRACAAGPRGSILRTNSASPGLQCAAAGGLANRRGEAGQAQDWAAAPADRESLRPETWTGGRCGDAQRELGGLETQGFDSALIERKRSLKCILRPVTFLRLRKEISSALH